MDNIGFSILLVVVGLFLGVLIILLMNKLRILNSGKEADKLIERATKEAEKLKRDKIIELKEESYKLKQDTDNEIKEKKKEIQDLKNLVESRENSLNKRDELLQEREKNLDLRDKDLLAKQKEIQEKDAKMESILKEQIELLERISGFSKEKARDLVMKKVEEDMSKEIAIYLRERENDAKLEADRKAKEYLVSSMQKYATDVANEQTVSTVTLPNDEMKGRIIGREGRNIRTIEAITGVDLIIDDTPETITVSCFDPIRREVARLALEHLIRDGRIQPGRIEEVVNKIKKEMDSNIMKTGEDTVFKLGIGKIDREIIRMIGRLKYRYSYGQNALQHSMEVAHLAGMMAAELGLNQQLAKRAGLLHDIGKAMDFEVEGSHIELGYKFCKKHGEKDVVLNAIQSHHGEVEPAYLISNLVIAADTISAARPGARYESLQNYINRLEDLEKITRSFDGVDSSYAIQAGREVRVMVLPDKVDDLACHKLARDIKDKIEAELTYPGQIKVTVIRETRSCELAK